MKITLTKATFYFNDPINLTPYQRTIDIDLKTLDESVIRKLNLGVVTGVVEVSEGFAEFKERVEALVTKNKPVEVIEQPIVEEIKEVLVEKTEEVREEVVKDIPKPKPTPIKKSTPAKKV